MSKIAIIADVHLLPETQKVIESLADNELAFPHEDTQPSTEELIKRTSKAEVVLVSPGTKITDEYFNACPSVKYIGICGTAKENVNLEAAKKRNIVVTTVVDYGDEPAAEFIFMQLEYLARGMGQYQWKDYPSELMGKTIGILGLGGLGQAIARLALAYKMDVLYYSRTRKQEWEKQGLKFQEKNDLLKSSNFIIISTPSNLQAIKSDEFELVQPNSVLVQASMGNCFDRDAFLNWVKANNNFALFDYSAGNDNYEIYKDVPNVIFPKIIAGHTHETRQRLGNKVIENLRNYLNNEQ